MYLRRNLFATLCCSLLAFAAAAPRALAQSNSVSATLLRNTLTVTVSYHGVHRGAGKLTVEVLDPEDKVLGRSERNVESSGNDGR